MRRRGLPRILRLTLLVTMAACFVAAGMALAASVGVTSKPITVHTAAAGIPPTTCTLSVADADSSVSELLLLSNFGTATTLDVQSLALNDYRSFVQFNLSPCSIPANSLITAASLELFMYAAPTASRTYNAHRVTATWTETGITWSNQPATAASATASVSTGTTSNVVLTWDVTGDVQAFVDGTTNHGWRVRDQTEDSLTSRLSQFRSAEYGTASQRPLLQVTYYP